MLRRKIKQGKDHIMTSKCHLEITISEKEVFVTRMYQRCETRRYLEEHSRRATLKCEDCVLAMSLTCWGRSKEATVDEAKCWGWSMKTRREGPERHKTH